MKKAVITLICAALALSACDRLRGKNKDVFLYDGVQFKSKARKVEKDRMHFVAEVRKVSRSIPGALEAGRHAGTRYCILNYGTSNIEWVRGPDVDPATVVPEGDNLIFEGFCRI